ncbi:MAG: LysR family transcriptional regulator [Oscillospiraceae bacterium]|nr:LysR family transcriptional regulator [Oscillospiraceae bacterium]MBR2890012.1 LysR family transcriptional regulator [Oscillospiraceae bacterium]
MELRQLKYFLAVADHRSFISAANDLFLSRQAVSKAVSQLEQELGVELFMRDTSGAFLTPAGMSFYERIRGPVMELNQAKNEMQQYGPRYQQMIRAAFSVGTLSLFEPLLQSFLQEQKNIAVDYWECAPGACEDLLANRNADIAISITPFSAPRLRTQTLYQAPLGVLLKEREATSGLDSLELSDLHWSPLACLQDGQCDVLCRKHRLTPQYMGTDVLRLITMAKSGRCSALLPQVLVPDYITGVRYVPLTEAPIWTVQLGYPESLEHNTLFQMALDELMTHVFAV